MRGRELLFGEMKPFCVFKGLPIVEILCASVNCFGKGFGADVWEEGSGASIVICYLPNEEGEFF